MIYEQSDITREEFQDILRCKNFTSSWRGTRYLPHAFTEQGIYLLRTVLKGELAVKQSSALVMAFKAMKDYIIDTQGLVTQRDLLRLSIQTTENTETIRNVQSILTEQQRLLMEHDDKLASALEQIGETVKKSEISPFMLDFSKQDNQKEYVFFARQLVKADVTYIGIYSQAKDSIHIVDDYIWRAEWDCGRLRSQQKN